MSDFFISVDVLIFRWINQIATHPILDGLMVSITTAHQNIFVLYGILPGLVFFGFWWDSRRFLKVLFVLALVVGVADNVSSRLIKKNVQRVRPNHVSSLTQAEVKQPSMPGGYSFPSNHAVNNFAGATVLSIAYPMLTWIWVGYAVLVAYSRPYVGVHYPSDVLFGALLGWLLAWFMVRFVFKSWLKESK